MNYRTILLIASLLYYSVVCGQCLDLELKYFSTDKESLVWETVYERGRDTFYLYSSPSASNWKEIAVIESKQNEGGSYYRFDPKIDRTNYFKLVWRDGFSYAVINVIQNRVFYNILGQQTNEGWRF